MTTSSGSAGYVDWQVVSAAVLTDLSVDMFMPDDMTGMKDRDWHWDGVRGLPVGPPADLQIYGSNLNGHWQGISSYPRMPASWTAAGRQALFPSWRIESSQYCLRLGATYSYNLEFPSLPSAIPK